MPRRIQRLRTGGWKMPGGAVYVGRPGKWGNPFKAGVEVRRDSPLWPYIAMAVPGGTGGFAAVTPFTAEIITAAYGWWFIEQPHLMLTVTGELGGRDLVCWCKPDSACHADFLLGMANDAAPED
jgi:hypothetical protein